MKSIHELTKEYGFALKGGCFCNGYETWKYQMPDGMTLEWRKYAATFRLSKGIDSFTDRWDNIINLEQSLIKHVKNGNSKTVSSSGSIY